MSQIEKLFLARLMPQWQCARCSAVRLRRARQIRGMTVDAVNRQQDTRERVVILGSGWAGYTLARELNPRKYQVILVSPRSYFVFTPLLASTSVGTLEFRTALEPIRGTIRTCSFFQGWADGVDFKKRTLTVEEAVNDPKQSLALTGSMDDNQTVVNSSERQVKTKKGELFDLTWDKLVIAVGCYAQTFKTKGVRENAFFLKDVGDARRIRNRLLTCFETAALPTTSETMKKQLLHFVVVGGGPTGIEFSAELHDIIYEDMRKIYPELTKHVRLTVYDVAPTVLGMFDSRLSEFAMKQFEREGIEIKTSHHVEELRRGAPDAIRQQGDVKDDTECYTIKLKEEGEVGVGMCVWSTGLAANPFVEKTLNGQVKRDPKSGSIVTNDRLQVLDVDGTAVEDLFGIGDCAVMEEVTYPATAQVASQKAAWLAKRLNKGDIGQQRFSWKNLGTMAYIGNWKAILELEEGQVSGRVAWFIWRSAYLVKSVSWRNRILIPIYWLVNWMFGRDISRF